MKHIIASSCPSCTYHLIVLVNDFEESTNACPRCHYAYSIAREFKHHKNPAAHHQAIWQYIFKLFNFKDLDDLNFTYVKRITDYINDGAPLKNFQPLPNNNIPQYKLPINLNNKVCTCDSLTFFRGCKCQAKSP